MREWQDRAPPREFLLVDPLDGTAEFIAGRREYTVNIALVRDGAPVVGVVAAPALGLIWRGAADHGAERLRFADGQPGAPERIHTRPWPAGERIAAVSRSHFDPASAAFLARLGPVVTMRIRLGDQVLPRRRRCGRRLPAARPTSEWDVAAGHALVVAAGGVLTDAGRRRSFNTGARARDFASRASSRGAMPAAARQFLR